ARARALGAPGLAPALRRNRSRPARRAGSHRARLRRSPRPGDDAQALSAARVARMSEATCGAGPGYRAAPSSGPQECFFVAQGFFGLFPAGCNAFAAARFKLWG